MVIHSSIFAYRILMDRGAWSNTTEQLTLSLCSVQSLICAQLFATLSPVASQAPLSMGFSRQEYWSRLICPPPGDLPDPGIKPEFPAFQAGSLPLSHQGSPTHPGTRYTRQSLVLVMDGLYLKTLKHICEVIQHDTLCMIQ